jgi:hypothetical protein
MALRAAGNEWKDTFAGTKQRTVCKQSISTYTYPVRNGVVVKDASSLAIGVYGNWGLLMNQATQASVGTDPWTVIQNKLHPAVAETELTPLDWSYLSRRSVSNKPSFRQTSSEIPRPLQVGE